MVLQAIQVLSYSDGIAQEKFMVVINGLLWIIAGVIGIPVLVLFVECLVALLPQRSRLPRTNPPQVAVLVPAHNEAAGIVPTLEGIQSQLSPNDRLVVIADNCTDETAELSRSTGATVLERSDSERRGKGYALDYGLNYLSADPPDIVVMMDADCDLTPESLPTVAQKAFTAQRPVQALYLMEQPENPRPKDSISALAFLVKNWVRPRGLTGMGQPCLLTGTGMAFPWEQISKSPLASGNIVEDMQLGFDLAIAGHPPLFCESALVWGRLPQQDAAATSQRTRWEHGHLQTLLTQVPRLLKAFLQQWRLPLLSLALDLLVPPLSLLVLLWAGGLVVAWGAVVLGASALPGVALAVQGGLIAIAIFSAWLRFGQQQVPLMTLLSVPFYVLWKIPLYVAFLIRRQTKWVRTERDPVKPSDS